MLIICTAFVENYFYINLIFPYSKMELSSELYFDVKPSYFRWSVTSNVIFLKCELCGLTCYYEYLFARIYHFISYELLFSETVTQNVSESNPIFRILNEVYFEVQIFEQCFVSLTDRKKVLILINFSHSTFALAQIFF